jgi:hypothetical protein
MYFFSHSRELVSQLRLLLLSCRDSMGNQMEREQSLLEAVTTRLMKTMADDIIVCVCVCVCVCMSDRGGERSNY